MAPFVSICVPSYNRPAELLMLLQSINKECKNDLEIVISEDKSPKRIQIIDIVESFKRDSPFQVNLHLNENNLGYDANIRQLVDIASGEFIIFMGDDDKFDTENLPKFIQFLKEHQDLGYILKTHTFIHRNGQKELFKYYPKNIFFDKGEDSYHALFRKSVFISGFCLKRKFALPFQTNRFDGGLLYQLYLLAEITLHHPSAFCDVPFIIQDESLRGVPMFGSSEKEKDLYTPGTVTVENSLNFMKGYFDITRYIDKKYSLKSTEFMKVNFSKYSYPVISIQRDKGRRVFSGYCKKLEEDIQINQSAYYYIYYYSLLLFGRKFCDQGIVFIKKMLGSTPNL